MDVSLSELRELAMDREACRAAIHGVEKRQTQLSDWTEGNSKEKELFPTNDYGTFQHTYVKKEKKKILTHTSCHMQN